MRTILSAALILAASVGSDAAGGRSAAATPTCPVALGDYRIALPANGKPWACSSSSTAMGPRREEMKKQALVDAARARGLAFVARRTVSTAAGARPVAEPGSRRDRLRPYRSSPISSPASVSDQRPRSSAVSRKARRWPGTRSAIPATGSPGRSPSRCLLEPAAGPDRLRVRSATVIHFHGTADTTFPLGGRAIGSRWHQGDTFASLAILKARAACRPTRAPHRHRRHRLRGDVRLHARPDHCLHPDRGHEGRSGVAGRRTRSPDGGDRPPPGRTLRSTSRIPCKSVSTKRFGLTSCEPQGSVTGGRTDTMTSGNERPVTPTRSGRTGCGASRREGRARASGGAARLH